MKKDIFIDTEIANKFAKPLDQNFRDLIEWLLKNDCENPANNAYLRMSNYLRAEYLDGNRHCSAPFSIAVIYSELQKQDRLIFTKNAEIQSFLRDYVFDKEDKLGLKCNGKDRNHFPLIFYSDRKKALIDDDNFINDIINFPRLSKGVVVKRNPADLDYK